jgi:ubiquinone/menaquinone biosynthesis C-methylase UbiE
MWRDTAAAGAEQARDLAGDRVLDVGCGSGAVTRDIAKRVGSQGLAAGLDPSPALLSIARKLAQEAGLGDRVEFREGNALRLPFPEASFDAVVCATVLSHVPKGESAIPELTRVLRPGGRLGVFDFDADMTLLTHPDRTLARRIVAAASDAMAVDGWLVRQLPFLFGRAGIRHG